MNSETKSISQELAAALESLIEAEEATVGCEFTADKQDALDAALDQARAALQAHNLSRRLP